MPNRYGSIGGGGSWFDLNGFQLPPNMGLPSEQGGITGGKIPVGQMGGPISAGTPSGAPTGWSMSGPNGQGPSASGVIDASGLPPWMQQGGGLLPSAGTPSGPPTSYSISGPNGMGPSESGLIGPSGMPPWGVNPAGSGGKLTPPDATGMDPNAIAMMRGSAMGAAGGVMMRAPDGSVRMVPSHHVQHYVSRGARPMNGY